MSEQLRYYVKDWTDIDGGYVVMDGRQNAEICESDNYNDMKMIADALNGQQLIADLEQQLAERMNGTSQSAGWAVPDWTDGYGNVKCAKCGTVQCPTFKKCVECCPHNTLDFIEDWHGPDDGGGWELDVECADCGKNFDWTSEYIIAHYKAVRRQPNSELVGRNPTNSEQPKGGSDE